MNIVISFLCGAVIALIITVLYLIKKIIDQEAEIKCIKNELSRIRVGFFRLHDLIREHKKDHK